MIIPAPVQIASGAGAFTLGASTRLLWRRPPAGTNKVVAALRDLLAPAVGPRLAATAGDLRATNAIIFNFDSASWPASLHAAPSPEAYTLTVDSARIVIHARAAHGAFNAVQTLRQLLPVEIERHEPPADITWQIPAITVHDAPRLAWRGLLVDVARHFLTVDEVKKLLDLMALHKLNVLQWHLTDDQGWRIEIKKYPRLTEIGAWRAESPRQGQRKPRQRPPGDRVRYGGYYTQAQVREVVAYAAARFITVVPEIELPGHSAAAIAAYPHLGNSDIPGYEPRVMTRWGIHSYTYAPKEETFAFLENVLREVLAIFPSRYIHIGGDEAPKRQWRASAQAQAFMQRHGLRDEDGLQSYFISRVGRFLAARGRRLIGWDEIQEGGTPAGATVMVWQTVPHDSISKPGRAPLWDHLLPVVKAGHDVVLTPNSHFYFDNYQADSALFVEPEAGGGLSTLEHAYAFDPEVPGLTPAEQARIIGVQGALWSEQIWDYPKLEYMGFPRTSALAEVAWSPAERRNFADFQTRLGALLRRMDELGVNYRPLEGIRRTPSCPSAR